SKGGDFSPVNKTVIIHDHYLYLKLPHPLKKGKNYSIDLNGMAENTAVVEFLYDPLNMISPSVHANIIAYSTNSSLKYAYVYQWMGDAGPLNLDGYSGNNFYLIDISSNDTAFTGQMTLRKDLETGEPDTYNSNDSPHYAMADVYECDFSSFNQSGEYKLYVEKIGCSYPFEIKEDAYREAFHQTAWGLYHQRSGPERDLPWSSWYKGTDHMPGVNGFTIEYSEWRIMDGANAFEELPAHATGEVFPANPGDWMPEDPDDWGWGGYFDAGDFDRRHVHMIVSEYLLLAYELKPENFIDNELKIPENNNGIPDIIDEARWAIDMHRRLQGPTGGICGGMEQNEHPKPGENSVTDSRPWYVYAEEPVASYHLAAANTQLAWCLALAGDISETDSLISQAERVYTWAGENMRSGDESKVAEYRMKAAAWLFRYTGKKKYHDQFQLDFSKGIRDDFAVWVYINTDHPLIKESIKNDLKFEIYEEANKLLAAGKKRAYRWANFDMYTLIMPIPPLTISWEEIQ
ncbi:MAG: glycoside hydrolase family 9 protein, partial [Bacteroidales bacterium]